MPARKALAFFFLLYSLPFAPVPTHSRDQSLADRAWILLSSASKQSNTQRRLIAVRVLGLVPNDARVAQLAEAALYDRKPEIRAAAATALGKMRATDSAPALKKVLSDKDLSVVLAAAHALHQLNDPACYEVYYAILTGQRKSSAGFFEQETEMFRDPKQLALMGFEQGLGFVPYAGMGWDAWRTIEKDRSSGSPTKAAAATNLAADPDPRTAIALVNAAHDRNWLIRVAALQALAQRGDPSLAPKIDSLLNDPKLEVSYTAAAAILRLTTPPSPKPTDPQP
jgi:HEAT repeat protein